MAHDEFVRRLDTACSGPAVAVLEALVFASGPVDERSLEGGTPHPQELIDFVSAHNWSDPTMATRFALAVTDLFVPLRVSGTPEQGAPPERPPTRRCRRLRGEE